MISETSLISFQQNKDKFLLKRVQILKFLKLNQPCNNMIIAKKTGITLSCVCGRMNDLREKQKYKYVTFSHKSMCPYTNSKTNFYKLTNRGEEYLNKIGGI